MNNIFNLGTFFKFLGKNKSYTAINVFGLAISLMFVILIGIYVKQELSTDTFHEKADKIYVLGNEEVFDFNFRIAYKIQERYPEIDQVSPVIPFNSFNETVVHIGDDKQNASLIFVDSTFFDFFSFKLYEADPHQVLLAKNYAVISKSFAKKAFGDKDPMGKVIQINDSVQFTVNGIMDDIKNSTLPYGDILVRIDNVRYFNPSMDSEHYDNAGNAYIFLTQKKGADLSIKLDDMTAFFKDIFWIYRDGIRKQVTLTPLKAAYFSEKYGWSLQHGDWKFVMILMSVGLLILIFAVINYINLTVAQAGFRAKEMAMRRLLGSSRNDLFIRLIFESTLLCLISFALAVFLAILFKDKANELLQTQLELNALLSPSGIVVSLAIILVSGIIAGFLPALFISNAQPIEITKGSFSRKSKMVFSKFFIVFQNIITVMLLVATLTMTLQTQHLIKAPLGYNTLNIINIFATKFESKEAIKTFANEVKGLASVKRAALGQGVPVNAWNNNTAKFGNKSISFQFLRGDSAYFEILGFQKIRENNLGSADNSFYFTEQAMKEAELEEDGIVFQGDNKWQRYEVAGIIKDIQLRNITQKKEAVMFGFADFNKENEYPWTILVEVQGDAFTAFNQVKAVFEKQTGFDFDGQFIDEQVSQSFTAQKRTATIIIVFTVIAVLISLLGLLAMSTYFIRLRTSEIAIRKVHGSTNDEVFTKLVKTFLLYVLIACIIAVPVIWYIMRGWLDDYAYRISLSPLIFIVAGMFCLLVSFVTVFWQSRIAANANPVKGLKKE